MADEIVDAFHQKFWGPHVVGPGIQTPRLRWMGHLAQKCPMDLFVYAEIIYETQPDLVIETGTAWGGSALFLADICTIVNRGTVVSIDINTNNFPLPRHDRLRYVIADSVGCEAARILENTRKAVAADAARCMAILDSDHSYEHVMAELKFYAGLVSPGCYLIVEDTNLNGHPIAPDFGPGPYEAVEAFLKEHPEFERDPGREKFLMTYNPGGYLRRIS